MLSQIPSKGNLVSFFILERNTDFAPFLIIFLLNWGILRYLLNILFHNTARHIFFLIKGPLPPSPPQPPFLNSRFPCLLSQPQLPCRQCMMSVAVAMVRGQELTLRKECMLTLSLQSEMMSLWGFIVSGLDNRQSKLRPPSYCQSFTKRGRCCASKARELDRAAFLGVSREGQRKCLIEELGGALTFYKWRPWLESE